MSNKYIENLRKTSIKPGFFPFVSFLIIIIAAVILIYKADSLGTHFDEMTSWQRFSSSIHDARHDYHSTNNHVLNSIFICFASRICGGYDQYIRVFPMISGLLYFIAAAYVVARVLENQFLRVACLFFLCFLRFVFYYLVMARGYGFALSALMLYAACVILFIRHPVSSRRCFIPALILSAINFYAIGAMISSVFCMAAMNAVFIFGFSFLTYKDSKSRLKPILINLALIAVFSAVLLFLFYRPILGNILHVEDNRYVSNIADAWKGWSSFVPFIRRLLIEQMFYAHSGWRWLSRLFLAAVAAGFCVILFRLVRYKQSQMWKASLYENRCGVYILTAFIAYLTVLVVYSVLLNHSPGLHRNQVFLMPLFVLSCFWLVDGLLKTLPTTMPALLLRGVIITMAVGVAVFHPRPYLHSFNKSGNGVAKPLLSQLRQLDPDKTWNLAFSKKAMKVRNNFRYYAQPQFGYKFSIFNPNYNIYVCRPDEKPTSGIFLNYDYFLKNHNFVIVLNDKPDFTKQVVEIKPIEP